MLGYQVCQLCGRTRPNADFARYPSKGGRHCRPCRRIYKLAKKADWQRRWRTRQKEYA